MKIIAFAIAASIAVASTAMAQPPAAAPAAAAKAKFSVAATPLGDLMRNPQTKPILQKHLGDLFGQVESNIDQIPAEFTLETLAEYAQGMLTPESLKAIDADLAKL